MKKTVTFSIITLLVVMGVSVVYGGEAAPQNVVDLANGTLAAYGNDPVIVEAVKAENAKGKTLDQIKGMDEKWKETAGVADYMQALIDNETGQYLLKIMDGAPYFAEIFVMDNQGANVAMTDKTSDYWQGDEAKFQKSFNNGAGAVFVDEVEFDDSTQTYLVQVSVPVIDGGKAIGAITFGIDVEKVE
jgi:hypothetical protein